MLRAFKLSASQLLAGFWVIFPVLGNALPPAYLLGFLIKRDRATPINPTLRAFAVLCGVYTLYVGGRSLAAGPPGSSIEPTGDAASLLLTAALAMWACRARGDLCVHRIYRGLVVMLGCVFVLTLGERLILGAGRPELLMGNPLNLTPVLLMPAILCTFTRFAGSRLWAGLGLAGFALAVIVVGGISVTRGPLVVLVGLTVVRITFVLIDREPLKARLVLSSGILLALVIGLAVSLTHGKTFSRYMEMVAPYSAPGTAPMQQDGHAPAAVPVQSGSMDVRLMMLRAGWAAFVDRPFLGHGPQYRFEAAVEYFPQGVTAQYSHLHNDFLTHAVAGGVPAVVLLCLILVSPALVAWRYRSNRFERRQVGVLFSLGFTGIAAANNVLFVDVSAFALGLSYVAAFLLLDALRPGGARQPAKLRWRGRI